MTNFYLLSDYLLVEVKNKIYAEINFGALKGAILQPLFYFCHFCCIPMGKNPIVYESHPEVIIFFCESVHPLPMSYSKIYGEIKSEALKGAILQPLFDFYHFCCKPMARNPIVHDSHPEVTKFFCESVYPLTMKYDNICGKIIFWALKGVFP